MTEPEDISPQPHDIAGIFLEDVAAEPEAVRVRIMASGHMFLSMVLPRTFIEQWVDNQMLAGKVLEVLISSHPAASIVNDLMPLLDGLVTLDPAKAPKWNAMRDNIKAIADAARAQKNSPTPH